MSARSARRLSSKEFWDTYAGTTSVIEYLEYARYVRTNVPSIAYTTFQFEHMKLLLNKMLPLISKFRLPDYSGTPNQKISKECKWQADTSITIKEGLNTATKGIEQSKLPASIKERLHTSINMFAMGDWTNKKELNELIGILHNELVALYHSLSCVVNNIAENIRDKVGESFYSVPNRHKRKKIRHTIKKMVSDFLTSVRPYCTLLLSNTIGGLDEPIEEDSDEPTEDQTEVQREVKLDRVGLFMSVFVVFLRDSFRYPGDKHEFCHSDPFCRTLDEIETMLIRINDFFDWLADKHRFSLTNMVTLYVSREYYAEHQNINNIAIIKPRTLDEMYTEAMAIFYNKRDIYKAVIDEFDYDDLMQTVMDEDDPLDNKEEDFNNSEQ